MKSLRDNYSESHGSASETFADLMFCALVILVLFVMALAVEVSQRVRSDLIPNLPDPDPVEVVNAEQLSTMTKAEVEALSKELELKSQQIAKLKSQLETSVQVVEQERQLVADQKSALNGEQRFTGAREPATLKMAYDYDEEKFHFLSAWETSSAETRRSGESSIEFMVRRKSEMVDIALKARKQRGYSFDEASAIYQAFSKYKQVKPEFESYTIEQAVVGISYGDLQSAYIAGDTEVSAVNELIITRELLRVYETPGFDSDEMYPRLVLRVDLRRKKINVNGVELSPRDLKEILLSVDGRGAMLDLEGLDGPAPEWLREEVLIPAGYVTGIPKLPD